MTCFVLGMLVTPPDVISQTILALPMYLLFEVGLFLGKIAHKPDRELDDVDNEIDRQIGSDDLQP